MNRVQIGTALKAGMAGLAMVASMSAIAFGDDAVPQKYLDGGIKAGMLCGTGVISYCDPGSTVGKGILADMAQAWGKELGVKVDVVGQSWEAIMPSAISGRTDVIAGIGDLDTRRAQFNFVDLFWSNDSILVKGGNPLGAKSWTDLCGKKMVASQGSGELQEIQKQNKAFCTDKGLPSMDIQTFGDQTATFLAVQSGRADGTVTDMFGAAQLMTQSPGVYAEAFKQPVDLSWAVGVPVSNPDLLKAVAAGVTKALKDGSLEAVLDKYGFSGILVEKPMINGKAVE